MGRPGPERYRGGPAGAREVQGWAGQVDRVTREDSQGQRVTRVGQPESYRGRYRGRTARARELQG